jgi:sugar phosphate isomerase/epimerase
MFSRWLTCFGSLSKVTFRLEKPPRNSWRNAMIEDDTSRKGRQHMFRRTTRRDFLRDFAVANSVGIAAGLCNVSLPRLTQAIAPIQRTAGLKCKFSMAAYSYRELFGSEKFVKSPLTLEDFLNDCAAMQLDGAELTSYYFPAAFTPTYLRGLKRQAFRLGLDVSGTAIANDFCYPSGRERDAEIALVKRWVDYAEILGAPVIRIFTGDAKPQQTPAEAHRLVVDGIEECCDYAGKHGVTLALENHDGLTATPEGALALVRDVKSPWFGVNLDTGNFHGADVYSDLAHLAPYAVNVQVKAVVTPGGQPKQPTDFKRLAHIMRDVGYRGYIVLEYEEDQDPRVACPKLVTQIRDAFA